MELIDRVRAATAKNAGLMKQAQATHAQAKRGVGAEIEAINTQLQAMTPGALALNPAKQAEYLRLIERRARLHEHMGS